MTRSKLSVSTDGVAVGPFVVLVRAVWRMVVPPVHCPTIDDITAALPAPVGSTQWPLSAKDPSVRTPSELGWSPIEMKLPAAASPENIGRAWPAAGSWLLPIDTMVWTQLPLIPEPLAMATSPSERLESKTTRPQAPSLFLPT